MTSRYKEVYQDWQANPEAFWAHAAVAIDWIKPWDKVFDPNDGPYGRWYAGAECNTCYNAVDRHVEHGRADQLALIHDSAVTGTQRKITYAQLLDEINALAAVLTDKGVKKGDRVIIYMAMVPEAVVAMLACARIGAVHSVVFGGFAAHELATRIDDAKPVMIIATSCGLEPGRVVAYKPMLDKAIEQAVHKVETCLILVRPQQPHELVEGRDFDYAEAVAAAAGREVACAVCKGDGSALYPLHFRYDRATQGRRARQWRASGGARMVDGCDLRYASRRRVLGGVRHRLGGRAFLHRLCAAVHRCDEHSL